MRHELSLRWLSLQSSQVYVCSSRTLPSFDLSRKEKLVRKEKIEHQERDRFAA